MWKENILAAGLCSPRLYKEKSTVDRYYYIIYFVLNDETLKSTKH